MSLKILIVEDERIVARDLKNILQNIGYEDILLAHSFHEALACVAMKQPDFALLDVNLDMEYDGIDLARVIQEKYHVPFIFLTSYSDKNTLERAKSVRSQGYIVKPFTEESIFAAIEIGIGNHQKSEMKTYGSQQTFFFIRDGRLVRKIGFHDVLYLEADNNYTHILTSSKKYTLRTTLKELLTQFPHEAFHRVHRSFAVNIHRIDSFDMQEVYFSKSMKVPLGRQYRAAFLNRINPLSPAGS